MSTRINIAGSPGADSAAEREVTRICRFVYWSAAYTGRLVLYKMTMMNDRRTMMNSRRIYNFV